MLSSAAVMLVASGCCHRYKHRRMMMMKHYGMMKHHGMKKKGCGGKYGRRGCKGKRGKGCCLAKKLLCPKKVLKCAKCLKLDKDQITKLHGILKRAMAKKIEFKLAKIRIKARMKVEWLEDNPDGAKIGTMLQQIVELKSKKMKQKLALLLEVRKVLTTEQYQKLIVMKMGRCGKGKGGCGGKSWGRGGCDKKPCCGGRGGCDKRPCRGGKPCPAGGPGRLPKRAI